VAGFVRLPLQRNVRQGLKKTQPIFREDGFSEGPVLRNFAAYKKENRVSTTCTSKLPYRFQVNGEIQFK
jgi:hypothetical protein